jgi:hypothetical protein
MSSATANREEIREYLLGSLSEDARQRFEERLLTADGVFEELLLCEEELTDDYAAGALSDEERHRFEAHFLSTPERYQKLRFALALNRYTADQSEKVVSAKAQLRAPQAKMTWAERFRAFAQSQPWALRAGAAFAVAVIAAGVLWLFLLRTPSSQTFVALVLTASNTNRAEATEVAKVRLQPGVSELRISLALADGLPAAAGYRVELENDKGEIKPFEITGQDAQSVSVLIPAGQLARGLHALRLYAIKTDRSEQRIPGSYFFNVE